MASITIRFTGDDPRIHTMIGQTRDGMVRLQSGPGFGLFGPYISLPAGRCIARVFFKGQPRGRVTMDICAESGKIVLASRDVDLGALERPGCFVELPATLGSPHSTCEVRLLCESEINADISSVEFELFQSPDMFLQMDPIGTWVLAEIRPGLRLWGDLGDTNVSRQCLAGNYEPMETAFVESFLKPGMAFIDIGANIGWYTVLAARIVGSSGLVYSFEPRPDTCAYLRKSMSENEFSHVQIRQLALSSSPGILPIATYKAAKSPGGTWLMTTEILQAAGLREGFERFEVEVARLDDLPIQRCDLLKIDIEGAEYGALQGARRTLARLRPTIVSEINPQALRAVSGISVADYLAFISEFGYQAHELTPTGAGACLGSDFAANPAISNVVLTPAV